MDLGVKRDKDVQAVQSINKIVVVEDLFVEK